MVDHPDDRWLAGVRWQPGSSVAATAVDICADVSLGTTRTGGGVRSAYPFLAVANETCGSQGWESQNYPARAREALEASEWAVLEAEFERGLLAPANPHLADPASTALSVLVGGAALSPKDALAALDEAIANARIGQGMIHATAFVIAQWVAARLLNELPDVDPTDLATPARIPGMLSPKGNIVVAGNGYTGPNPSSAQGTPAAADHSVQWAFATDLVVVHRQAEPTILPQTLAQALNRATNEVTFRAMRPYVVAWSRLLHAAVAVSTPLEPASASGTGAAAAVAVTGASPQVIRGAPSTYRGFTLRNTDAANPATVQIWDNATTGSGALLDDVQLAPSESARESYDDGIRAAAGITITVTGTVEGSIRVAS